MEKLKLFLPHLIAIAIFLGCCAAYFAPQLSGKVIRQGDVISGKAMQQELIEYEEETGEESLWTNSIFSGMPTYQIRLKEPTNIFKKLFKVLRFGIGGPIGIFYLFMFLSYMAFRSMKVDLWLSILGAVLIGLMTNNLILYEAGHAYKVYSLMSIPLIFAGLYMIFIRKKMWYGLFVFTLGMGLNLHANHYQMTYYFAMVVVPLALYWIAKMLFKTNSTQEEENVSNTSKSTSGFGNALKIGALLSLSLMIALGANFTRFMTSLDYAKDTMRGKSILEKTGEKVTSSSETDGLAWDYAMQWSNGANDVLASFIPGIVGGGSAENVDRNSAFNKELRKRGSGTQKKAPLYWGDLPFTSGPAYLGITVIFLLILSLFTIRAGYKWWFVFVLVFTLILSMGKHFESVNRFLFDYLPYFNKFRSPNSVLSITSVIIPIASILGIQAIIDAKDRQNIFKPLLFTASAVLAFLVAIFVIGQGFSFESPGDARYAQMGIIPALIEDRKALFQGDMIRSIVYVALLAGLFWAYIKFNLNNYILLGGIALLTLTDVVGVSLRYVSHDNFVRKPKSLIQARPVDEQILRDKDPYYRIFDQTVNSFNSAAASFFHHDVGGYHPAKLQRYQDIIDRHLIPGNLRVYNMLNTKYFISPGENNQPQARLNAAAMGNAWFVNKVLPAASANEEIDLLNNFDPNGEAVVHQEFSAYTDGLNLSKNGSIRLTNYAPNRLEYASTTSSEQLAVFSDIYYGPNKGWQAYLDGEPVDHIRANFLLRAMKVPPGDHKIVFEFAPSIYSNSVKIALVASLVFLLFLAWALFLWFRSDDAE